MTPTRRLALHTLTTSLLAAPDCYFCCCNNNSQFRLPRHYPPPPDPQPKPPRNREGQTQSRYAHTEKEKNVKKPPARSPTASTKRTNRTAPMTSMETRDLMPSAQCTTRKGMLGVTVKSTVGSGAKTRLSASSPCEGHHAYLPAACAKISAATSHGGCPKCSAAAAARLNQRCSRHCWAQPP